MHMGVGEAVKLAWRPRLPKKWFSLTMWVQLLGTMVDSGFALMHHHQQQQLESLNYYNKKQIAKEVVWRKGGKEKI